MSAKAVAVKQAAILEKALEANPTSEELLLVMMAVVLPEVCHASVHCCARLPWKPWLACFVCHAVSCPSRFAMLIDRS
jgi:hypothetical protein